MTPVAAVSSVMAIVTLRVRHVCEVAVIVYGGAAGSTLFGKQRRETISSHRGRAERHRHPTLGQDACDRKDNCDKRDQPSQNVPVAMEPSGRLPHRISSHGRSS
jgi:hypothetical protein